MAIKHNKRSLWDRAKENALERDGYKCCECGTWDLLTIHHIKTLASGAPRDELMNLRTLCRPCHDKVHMMVSARKARRKRNRLRRGKSRHRFRRSYRPMAPDPLTIKHGMAGLLSHAMARPFLPPAP